MEVLSFSFLNFQMNEENTAAYLLMYFVATPL